MNIFLAKIASIIAAPIFLLGSLFIPVAQSPNVGATLPQATGVFETSLAAPITSTATTMTLTANAVRGGGAVSGYSCFTLDEGSAQAEVACGTVSSTTVSSMTRGISYSDGITSVTANKFSHRRGANVKITDFPLVQILKAQNNGDATFPNILQYASGVTPSSADDLADKGYVDGVAIAGAPDATTTVKGISKISVAPVSPTAPIAVGDNDGRVPTQSENDALQGTGTPSGSNRYVTADTNALNELLSNKSTSTSLGTSDTLYPSQKAVKTYVDANLFTPVYKSGTTTKDASDASTAQTIAHGLGKIPKYVRIRAIVKVGTSTVGTWLSSETAYNGTTQTSMSLVGDTSGNYTVTTAAFRLATNTAAADNRTDGVVTFDATNITITWTKTNSPTGIYTLLWEAQG